MNLETIRTELNQIDFPGCTPAQKTYLIGRIIGILIQAQADWAGLINSLAISGWQGMNSNERDVAEDALDMVRPYLTGVDNDSDLHTP